MEAGPVQPDKVAVDPEVSAANPDDDVRPAIPPLIPDIAGRQQLEAELLTLRKAVESSGEVIFLTDRAGIITYVNPEFTRLYGYQADEVVGISTPRILKSGLMTAQDYERFWQALLNEQVVKREFTNRCKDGRVVTVEGSASLVLDESGEIAGFLAIQRDITQRVIAEKNLKQRNKELAALNAVATTVSQSLDLNQILNDALDAVLQLDMFGGAAKGMLFGLDEQTSGLLLISHRGTPKEHPCLARPPGPGECLCGLVAQEGKVIISEDCWTDERHSRHWRTMPDHKDICLPLKVRGEVLGVMNVRLPATHEVADHDVELLTSVADQIGVAIENARLFEAISGQHEQLRALSSRLAEAEETERRRLAQELHDKVGRKLTALGINLNIIRTEMPGDTSHKANSLLVDSQELVEQTTDLIRGVMSELRPPMLDDLGLADTLHWYGDQFAARTGISVSMQGDELARPLPARVENALFRIAQESLNNVAKHAQATEVTVSLESDGEIVRLIVADDGIGVSPDRPVKPGEEHGWGLLIMAERAEAVGGRCWIEPRPSKEGTRVIVEVPR
ncbi:MAG: PAS domain S-box protein [Chloroflexota bacterium]|nr:MAG: PAS domain S-box protein [Chloroflexota bacterium]